MVQDAVKPPEKDRDESEAIELDLLLDGIYRRYGYDFRNYSKSSLKRRLEKCLHEENLESLSGLLARVLHDPACMERVIENLSVDVTAMFRDPQFWRAFKEKVCPLLYTYPHVRIWIAGCATGEEVYSLAILLHEDGLLEKSTLYATDINGKALARAKDGIFPLRSMKDYSANYIEAGLAGSFSDYFTAKYNNAIMNQDLRNKIVWAQHNLVTDVSFNEFNVILCRNVMIYFNRTLQARVHDLIYDSLARSGIIGIGLREMLKFTSHENDYEPVAEDVRLYRKVR